MAFLRRFHNSVQHGSITISGTNASASAAALPIALTGLAVVRMIGIILQPDGGGGVTYQAGVKLSLNTGTGVVTATRHAPSSAADSTIYYDVIDYNPAFIKNIQLITTTITAGNNNAVSGAFTAVDMNNTELLPQGWIWTSSLGTEAIDEMPSQELTSTTQITAHRGNGVLTGQVDVLAALVETY